MIDTYSIVGGGISACALATYLSEKHTGKISIYESSSSIGGVLKDLIFDDKIYFNGVQYIEDNTSWINILKKKKEIYNNLIFFEDKNASYTNFNGEEILSKDFPCPIFNTKVKLENLPKIEKFSSLKDRLGLYPKEISENLESWVNKFGINCNLLSNQCAENGLMIVRVLPSQNNSVDLLNLKKKDKTFDTLYGLPRKTLKLPSVKVIVPKYGYNDFFLKLKEYLVSKKTSFNAKAIIKSSWNKKKLTIKNLTKPIQSQNVIWTANPTDLIKNFNSKKMDSYPVMIKTFTGDLNIKLKDFFYVNVFSHELDIFRMYIYNINNQPKITLECFDKINGIEDSINKIEEIFNKFGYKLKLDTIKKFHYKRQKKYFLVSVQDKKILQDFYDEVKDSNLTPGAWDIYHREKKINSILSNLE